MRLLRTESFELETFYGSDVPKYAILSHTWGREQDEVSFQELHNPGVVSRPGYRKIKKSCELAEAYDCPYVWIDTCCIDKTNPTELSEAINSMFRWYKGAAVCFVYLADVLQNPNVAGTQHVHKKTDITNSRWFTRGWTLQELLAPKNLRFYDRRWSLLGSSVQYDQQIEAATGISHWDFENLDQVCVGVKMSWLSQRHTTRVEDMAYCMLGIFEINLPLIYGEGEKAFVRLQREIFLTNPDETLFAWQDEDVAYAGLLAPYPSCFRSSGRVGTSDEMDRRDPPLQLTNQGISLKIQDFRHHEQDYSPSSPCQMRFSLRCFSQDFLAVVVFHIHLKRLSKSEWVRHGSVKAISTDHESDMWSSTSAYVYVPLYRDSESLESRFDTAASDFRATQTVIFPRKIPLRTTNTNLDFEIMSANLPPQCFMETREDQYRIISRHVRTFYTLLVRYHSTVTLLSIANLNDGARTSTRNPEIHFQPARGLAGRVAIGRFNQCQESIVERIPGACCLRDSDDLKIFSWNLAWLCPDRSFALEQVGASSYQLKNVSVLSPSVCLKALQKKETDIKQ